VVLLLGGAVLLLVAAAAAAAACRASAARPEALRARGGKVAAGERTGRSGRSARRDEARCGKHRRCTARTAEMDEEEDDSPFSERDGLHQVLVAAPGRRRQPPHSAAADSDSDGA